MISPRTIAVAAALALLLLSRGAAAEPLRLKSRTICTTEGGSEVPLPPETMVLMPPDWLKLDTEVKRLQEQETRLMAENKSLRKSNGWAGWKTVAVSLLIGVAAGAYAFR